MALKGKRKQRGGQGRRRPAAMPRPQAAARKPPWYKTTAGLSVIAISSLIFVIVAIALFVNNRNDAKLEAQREDELNTYTGEIEALVQEVSEPASAVAAAAAGAGSGAPPPEDADDWVKQFDDAQTQLFQLIAPQGAAAANTIFQQSVLMYRAAAKNFALAQQAEGEVATELQTQAATLAGTASALWESGKSVLDDVLEEAGLPPSDFRSPSDPGSQPQPQQSPGTEITIPPSDEGAGGGNDGGGGGGDGNGGNGDG
jgi:hypothetical protein